MPETTDRKPQARMGDISDHGGCIVTGASSWLVDGKPAARMGDLHDCPDHGTTPIVTGSARMMIDGKPAARAGDICGCGAVITTGSARSIIA